MNAPQAVTERYVTNFIHYGRNKEFDLISITMHDNIVEGEHVGVHFKAYIKTHIDSEGARAFGATIQQAVRRALEKHGVTFR